ncbi:hypothetical protein E2C01_032354 [Portunus trituberculatus]|uniref:Uncharacterized protein n=1 Tax=Portunus trituberculatus TaxID=210409 RepID=A0A5B7F0U6_PORTR|nr:hypothetical protein [Portunus trituberculatus]
MSTAVDLSVKEREKEEKEEEEKDSGAEGIEPPPSHTSLPCVPPFVIAWPATLCVGIACNLAAIDLNCREAHYCGCRSEQQPPAADRACVGVLHHIRPTRRDPPGTEREAEKKHTARHKQLPQHKQQQRRVLTEASCLPVLQTRTYSHKVKSGPTILRRQTAS